MNPAVRFLMTALALVGGPAAGLAQTADERGAAAAAAARGVFGTQEGLVTHGIEPFSAERPMRTVDGQAFNAALSCEASQQFLRVTMFPSGSDIGRFLVEMDENLDGTVDRTTNFTGPFAGVCSNGVIRCAAGSWNNCQFLQWDTSGGTLALTEVPQQQLGACYCFNASCGNNLLAVNSQKVVSDLGTSVLTAAQQLLPRVASTRTVADALSIQFIGQRGSCGTDDSPEQFYRRPNELAAAGVAALSVPGTVANFVSGTAVARARGASTMRCAIQREIDTLALVKRDILQLVSSSRGAAVDCGAGCLRFRIGDDVQRLYGDGSGGTTCRLASEHQQYLVGHPDRIESVRVVSGALDDGLRLRANSAIVYNSVAGWTGAGVPASRCDWGYRTFAGGPDIGSAFAGGGTVRLDMEVAHDRRGAGHVWLEARVREGCELAREEVVDGCIAAQANTRCRLSQEWVDGVQTVRDGRTTGLGPLASSQTVGQACHVQSGPRAWWRTEREYECRTEAPVSDLSAAAERYESIHQSIDLGSGAFADRLRNPDGTYQSVSTSVPALAERGAGACTPTCRTRRPRPGANVATNGPTTAQNVTGVAYDFSFKDCESGTCPVEAGEEVVGACDCHNNFAQAVALMQTIRMVAEDASCEVPQ